MRASFLLRFLTPVSYTHLDVYKRQAIGRALPSRGCIEANAHALARYAVLCQEAGLVPVVEPEVIMDGEHTLERCCEVTEEVLRTVFSELFAQRVVLELSLIHIFLLNSIWKRLLFAWTQKDINILLTSYLMPQSRIQIWRSVQERVSQVAPFLLLDHDPYAVLSQGKLYWIQDAYTVSDRYPYSNVQTNGSAQGMNYIRNSVKAVVDMYDGTVALYAMDSKDPVLDMYERAFPGVFKDLTELPADLRAHLRYPEDLFGIQSTQYETFHMTDPQVFYNREDLWVPPQEKYDGAVNPMDPYYMLMKLPGSGQLEYLIMTPFTPQKRDNMIAWLAARCDFPDYGKMLFYELPKDKLIFGPNQISAMIDQSTTISQPVSYTHLCPSASNL